MATETSDMELTPDRAEDVPGIRTAPDMASQGDLWAVHTLGMDDLQPCASRRLAVRNATWMNLGLVAHLAEWDDELTPFVYNVPVIWDGNEEGHASALAAQEERDSRWSDPRADVMGDLAREQYGRSTK